MNLDSLPWKHQTNRGLDEHEGRGLAIRGSTAEGWTGLEINNTHGSSRGRVLEGDPGVRIYIGGLTELKSIVRPLPFFTTTQIPLIKHPSRSHSASKMVAVKPVLVAVLPLLALDCAQARAILNERASPNGLQNR